MQIRRAQELDPLSVSIATDVGEILCWAGRYDEAIPQLRLALEMEPNFAVAHNVLGIVLLKQNQVADAITELERAFRLDDSPRMLATLGYAYGVAGRRADAQALAVRLRALSKERYISPFQLALIHAGLGEDDRAFALLASCYDERSDNMAILRVYPLLERLRSDPRFGALMARVDAHAVRPLWPASEGKLTTDRPESGTGFSWRSAEHPPILTPAVEGGASRPPGEPLPRGVFEGSHRTA